MEQLAKVQNAHHEGRVQNIIKGESMGVIYKLLLLCLRKHLKGQRF